MARADATKSDARARRGIAAVAGTGIFGDRRRRATSDLTTNESWKGAPHRGCFGGRRCQLPRFLLTVRNAIYFWLLEAPIAARLVWFQTRKFILHTKT
jgi:hypothetical protein